MGSSNIQVCPVDTQVRPVIRECRGNRPIPECPVNLPIPVCPGCRECPQQGADVVIAVVVVAKRFCGKRNLNMNHVSNSELLLPNVRHILPASRGRRAQCLRHIRAVSLLPAAPDQQAALCASYSQSARAPRRIARTGLPLGSRATRTPAYVCALDGKPDIAGLRLARP